MAQKKTLVPAKNTADAGNSQVSDADATIDDPFHQVACAKGKRLNH
ncbi:hypothetical protein [Nisaea nitritireducens]|nr:hypothetical protein [Nisaea nitritireducens]